MENHNTNEKKSLQPNLKEYGHLLTECGLPPSFSMGVPTWIIALYVRLSDQQKGMSVSESILNQIRYQADFLENFNDFVIHDIYIDDGHTGTDFDRNDYQRMIHDAERGAINCIIVIDLTRYARNVADGIKGLEEFVFKYKVRFISIGIPKIDTFIDPTAISSGELYQALSAAEDFARTTSIKIRNMQKVKRKYGERTGGFAPYGYLLDPKDKKKIFYDPEAGEIVKQIFSWYVDGYSDRAIAKKLNELSIPNPTEYKRIKNMKYHNPNSKTGSILWTPRTVSNILQDKSYIGYCVQGKSSSFDHLRHKQISVQRDQYEEIPNRHEKTISDELFQKAQEIRASHPRAAATGEVNIFAKKVYCSTCGRAMRKNSAGQGDHKYYYMCCRTYKDFGKQYCPIKRAIRISVLENVVLKAIQSQILLVINLQEIVDSISSRPDIITQSKRIQKLIELKQTEYTKTELLLKETYYDWKKGNIAKELYLKLQDELNQQLVGLQTSINDLGVQQREIENGLNSRFTYFERFIKYKNIEKLDRAVILELIERIYINEDKSVKIIFNYQDQFQLILDYVYQNAPEVLETQSNKPKTLIHKK